MKVPFFVIAVTLLMSPMLHAESRICPMPWTSGLNSGDCVLTSLTVEVTSGLTGQISSVDVSIRNGYLPESPSVPFKGNVIYYEGLGDSMLNHLPLFLKLTNAGYRVIAFDYMGQGGSTGKMNNTRILQIGIMGNSIWNLNARDLGHFPRKTIIGWSTGGLAAFLQAQDRIDVNAVVLIAPGIAPNTLVGEQKPLRGQFNLITLASLTTAKYDDGTPNPHVDPIKPKSPLLVPGFAWDLVTSANVLTKFPMRKTVAGFVLLSGENDTYVDARATREIVGTYAPQFQIKQYPGALHEIDNEADPNGPDSRQDILNFIEANGVEVP